MERTNSEKNHERKKILAEFSLSFTLSLYKQRDGYLARVQYNVQVELEGDKSEEETSEHKSSQKYAINLFTVFHNLSNEFFCCCCGYVTELARNAMATACTWNISQMLTCEMSSRGINWNCNLNTRRTHVLCPYVILFLFTFVRWGGGSARLVL